MGFKQAALHTCGFGAVLILSFMSLRTVFFRLGLHSSLLGVCPAPSVTSSVVQWPDARLLPLPEQLSLGNEVIERFRAALRFKTISEDSGHPPGEQLLALINFFQRGMHILSSRKAFSTLSCSYTIINFYPLEFPLVHSSPFVRREIVSNYSLLFTLSSGGPKEVVVDSDPPPFLIIAHTDVVPGDVLGTATNASSAAGSASARGWSSQPFAAEMRDGFIYGRGSMDCKLPVLVCYALLFHILRAPRRALYGVLC